MNIPDPVFAAVLTVLGGALTLVVGQIFIKSLLEPAAELKREIGKIAYSLDFYANRRYSVSPEIADETRMVFRTHACRLRELANVSIGYDFWRSVLSLPERDALFEASAELIGHSNFPQKPEGIRYDRSKEIRSLLGIRSLDHVIADRKARREA